MKIKDILKKSNQILIQNNIDESLLKSRILLANTLKVEKEYLIIHDEDEISKSQENDFFEKIRKIS